MKQDKIPVDKGFIETYCSTTWSSQTSMVISVSTLDPGAKVQGDFQAEGDSMLLLNGVSTYLENENKNKKMKTVCY